MDLYALFVTNQHSKQNAMFMGVFVDKGASLIQVIEIMKIRSTFIAHLYCNHHYKLLYSPKNYQGNANRMFSHSHLKLNTNEMLHVSKKKIERK